MQLDPGVSAEQRQQFLDAYSQMNQSYRREFSHQQALEEDRLNAELLAAEDSRNCKLFWQLVKRRRGFARPNTGAAVRDLSGELRTGDDAAEVWRKEYERVGTVDDEAEESTQQASPFDDQFKKSVLERLRQLAQAPEDGRFPELNADFTMAELLAALRKLKRHAAPGPDHIPGSLLHLMGSSSLQAVLLLFNSIWRSQTWPSEWRQGTVTPHFKHGGQDRTKASDYRPITMTSSLSKWFELILHNRLSSWVEASGLLVEEQCGFRAGRSTMDQVFTLHELLAKRREQGKRTFLAFLDVQHAYDRVWRQGLLWKLQELGVGGHMFGLLSSMLERNSRRVASQGSLSEEFTTFIGLPQGAVLSPLLYAIFINALALELNQLGLGVSVFDRRISVLLYADDIVLVADSAEDLQRMLNCANAYACKWRFRFNTKAGKSDVLISGAADDHKEEARFSLGSQPLHISDEYRYLGVEIGRADSWDRHLERVLLAARMQMLSVWHAVRGRAPLHIATAVHLFKTQVRPIMEYAESLWGCLCSNRYLTQLDRLQITYGRLVLRLPRQVANEYILRELHLEPMRERAEKAQLNFFGRLAAMGPQRLAGHIFRQRCDEVDQGAAGHSWCNYVKPLLLGVPSLRVAWETRSKPVNWKGLVNVACRAKALTLSDHQLNLKSSLALFKRLRPMSQQNLRVSLRHPGVALRFKLRANTTYLMDMVCARYHKDVDAHNRWCLLCDAKEVENAEHFVSHCVAFEAERAICLGSINSVLGTIAAPRLRQAMQTADPALFLGDKLQELPLDVRHHVDRIICNYLMVAWRQRDKLWLPRCLDNNPWLLQ